MNRLTVIVMVTKFNGQPAGIFNINEKMPLIKREEYPSADFLKCRVADDGTILEAIEASTERKWNEQEMQFQLAQLRNMNTV